MRKSFLGRGWRFPVNVSGTGGIDMSEENESIEQAIRMILGTAVGERVMRPQFGCEIHNYVFHPNDASTASVVSYYVKESIQKWEPRVQEVRVRSYPAPDSENTMLIDIEYEVRSTNSLENMVYPFYLRREQDL